MCIAMYVVKQNHYPVKWVNSVFFRLGLQMKTRGLPTKRVLSRVKF